MSEGDGDPTVGLELNDLGIVALDEDALVLQAVASTARARIAADREDRT